MVQDFVHQLYFWAWKKGPQVFPGLLHPTGASIRSSKNDWKRSKNETSGEGMEGAPALPGLQKVWGKQNPRNAGSSGGEPPRIARGSRGRSLAGLQRVWGAQLPRTPDHNTAGPAKNMKFPYVAVIHL
jgi:hypothetical protein